MCASVCTAAAAYLWRALTNHGTQLAAWTRAPIQHTHQQRRARTQQLGKGPFAHAHTRNHAPSSPRPSSFRSCWSARLAHSRRVVSVHFARACECVCVLLISSAHTHTARSQRRATESVGVVCAQPTNRFVRTTNSRAQCARMRGALHECVCVFGALQTQASSTPCAACAHSNSSLPHMRACLGPWCATTCELVCVCGATSCRRVRVQHSIVCTYTYTGDTISGVPHPIALIGRRFEGCYP